MNEVTKKEIGRNNQSIYFCPECGKPFESVNATESHLHNTYELHLKAWHGKLHGEAHGQDLASKVT